MNRALSNWTFLNHTSTLRSAVLASGVALAAILSVTACSPQADAPETVAIAEAPLKVADFQLNDQNGQPHRLHDLAGKSAVVLMMQGNGCPIVQKLTPTIKETVAEWTPRNVAFLMVNSNIQDSPETIRAELGKFELDAVVLKDADQALGRALKAERTAEVFVIDPKSWTVVYRGPIDDRLTYGRERAAAENHYLRDVLTAVLAGQPAPDFEVLPDGCLINFVDS
jgi:peroxiredoxin